MTRPDLTTAYRQRLMAHRADLLEQISAQRGGARSRADVAEEHFSHPEDSPAQVASERDLEFALNEHETAALGEIASALERLDAGTYGQCTACACAIAPERLLARPEAPRCIVCQERAEQPAAHARA